MDNNEVYALFEDIKSGLKSIGIAEYFFQRKPGTD